MSISSFPLSTNSEVLRIMLNEIFYEYGELIIGVLVVILSVSFIVSVLLSNGDGLFPIVINFLLNTYGGRIV